MPFTEFAGEVLKVDGAEATLQSEDGGRVVVRFACRLAAELSKNDWVQGVAETAPDGSLVCRAEGLFAGMGIAGAVMEEAGRAEPGEAGELGLAAAAGLAGAVGFLRPQACGPRVAVHVRRGTCPSDPAISRVLSFFAEEAERHGVRLLLADPMGIAGRGGVTEGEVFSRAFAAKAADFWREALAQGLEPFCRSGPGVSDAGHTPIVLPYRPCATSFDWVRSIAALDDDAIPAVACDVGSFELISSFHEAAHAFQWRLMPEVEASFRASQGDVAAVAYARTLSESWADAVACLSHLATGGDPSSVAHWALLRKAGSADRKRLHEGYRTHPTVEAVLIEHRAGAAPHAARDVLEAARRLILSTVPSYRCWRAALLAGEFADEGREGLEAIRSLPGGADSALLARATKAYASDVARTLKRSVRCPAHLEWFLRHSRPPSWAEDVREAVASRWDPAFRRWTDGAPLLAAAGSRTGLAAVPAPEPSASHQARGGMQGGMPVPGDALPSPVQPPEAHGPLP